MFIGRPEWFESNLEDAKNAHARPAIITRMNGTTEPGVGIFNAKKMKFILPLSEAIRLSNQIIDAAESKEHL